MGVTSGEYGHEGEANEVQVAVGDGVEGLVVGLVKEVHQNGLHDVAAYTQTNGQP
jgi:hypothetical protein